MGANWRWSFDVLVGVGRQNRQCIPTASLWMVPMIPDSRASLSHLRQPTGAEARSRIDSYTKVEKCTDGEFCAMGPGDDVELGRPD